MKSGRIKLIWSVSIAAALLVILLQGYWLRNQYEYELDRTADETIVQTIAAWDKYKADRKERLKEQKDKVKAYNSNINAEHSTVYYANIKGEITHWTINIDIRKNNVKKPIVSSDTIPQKEKELNAVNNAIEVLKGTQSNIFEQKEDSIPEKGLIENIVETDSTLRTTFIFSTKESSSSVYNATDVYLADLNLPLKMSELDSLIEQQTGNESVITKAQTLRPDSLLWEPISLKDLSLFHPTVSVHIPFNTLKQKVAVATLSLAPTRVLQTMALQILISLILILLLVVCLALQIKTISRQQRIGKLRQNFVNTTIHELKRPVQMLKTIVSYLQETESENEAILSEARTETDNLTLYLQKLREVNIAESVKESLRPSYFDFTLLAQANIANVRKNSKKAVGIEARFPSEPLTIVADKDFINNVVVNLLENAVKYSGESAEIVFEAKKQNNRLVFSISDNGIGIAPAEQAYIFEPFFRSKNPLVATLPGMGLGLNYVRMAVEAHRGTISLISKPLRGTTVTIEIPQQ